MCHNTASENDTTLCIVTLVKGELPKMEGASSLDACQGKILGEHIFVYSSVNISAVQLLH